MKCNSDKAGDVISTVELIEDVAEKVHSSRAQVQGQPQAVADQSDVKKGDADRKSKMKQQLKLPELQADLSKAGVQIN